MTAVACIDRIPSLVSHLPPLRPTSASSAHSCKMDRGLASFRTTRIRIKPDQAEAGSQEVAESAEA